MVAQFAIPLVNKIANPTLKEAYTSEIGNICDLDFVKLLNGSNQFIKRSNEKKEEVKRSSSSVIKKSVLGVFTALIQHPKLAKDRIFDLIGKDSRFLFLNDIKNSYEQNPEVAPSIIFEQIDNEKIKNLFGEALVSEIKLSIEDAKAMIEDCIDLISKSEKDREEILKEKYNMQEILSAEKRELQQIILKKDNMSEEDQILLKNLSSK
jgi:DNA primase